MAIYLVRPPKRAMPSVRAFSAGAPGKRARLAAQAEACWSFLDETIGRRPTATARSATPPAEPKVLGALRTIILDDPDEAALANMREAGAEVQENVILSLLPPVAVADVGEMSQADAVLNAWHLPHIGIERARQLGLTGSGVRLGILDTGIDAKHAEFQGKRLHFREFDQFGGAVGDSPRDAGLHGTHVAGLAAGRNVGVACDADLAMGAVLTLEDRQGRLGGSLAQIAAGLDWLLSEDFGDDKPLIVVNASLGGEGYHDYLYNTLNDSRELGDGQMIAAIGNAGRAGRDHHGSPGNYDIVLGVGAIDRHDRVADFSDWGNVSQHGGIAKPDICAPGVRVLSSVPDGRYAELDGTSMASPLVAGAAGLMVEADTALADDMSALSARVLDCARDIGAVNAGRLERIGRGCLDLRRL